MNPRDPSTLPGGFVRLARHARRMVCGALTAAALLLPQPVAAVAGGNVTPAGRPRICLVLGGGGARGAAHVGVLKVLEQLRIPVDCIAGTSMGSIVGSLYASGMSPEEIEKEMRSMDWDDLFQDEPSRAERSFRRKRDDDLYTAKAKLGFNNRKIEFPLAFIRGQKFDLELNRLLLPVADVKNFDQLPIPFRAVAADLETGKPVALGRGSLAKSVRASMAVPAAFDPVKIDGRLLVDGGIADNVPVDVARRMGGDVFIVVDVGSGLYGRQEITTALDVTGQLANFLFTLNTERQLKSLGSRDVLIRPPLGDIGGASFDRVGDAIPIGEQAAEATADALRRYSLSPEQYAQYLAGHKAPVRATPTIDFVHIVNHTRLADAVIAARISAKPGEPLDVQQLEHDIGDLYGLELFESVRYDLVREDDKTGLVITATDKSWGPGYLQFGVSTSNNLQGDSTFRFGTLYTLTEINSLNGEWRVGAQLGYEPGIFTEIYQPLDPASRYFVSGLVGYATYNINVFDAAGTQTASYWLNGPRLELGFGRDFGTWGEGRIGYRRESGTAEVRVGEPAPKTDWEVGEAFLRLSDDKMDSLYFPRHGHIGTAEYRWGREGLGADTDYDQLLLTYSHAVSWGANTFLGGLGTAITFDNNAPLERLFRLGGFLRLSGLQDNQLSGQSAGLAELIYMRRTYKIQFFETYVGASLEFGNVWQNTSDISTNNVITAGSVFLGLNTPIGPLYMAYGRTDRRDRSIYIYLGPRLTL
jgi:NTE family protein